jgi:hypothetical protein
MVTLSKEQKLLAEEIADLYDDTPEAGQDGLYGLELNDGLTYEEILKAPEYALMTRGHMLVTGQPGSGKGVFGDMIAWTVRRLFANKKALLDYKPKPAFDLGYEYNRYNFFDPVFIAMEIKKMAKASGLKNLISNDDEEESELTNKNKRRSKKQAELEEIDNQNISIATKWRQDNEVKLSKAVMVLDEFKKYCHNRNPHSLLNKTMGSIISVWRHLDLLILGMCPQKHEIDQYSSLFYVTHEVRCSAMMDGHSYKYRIFKARYVGTKGVIETTGKPEVKFIDGAKPRPEIGNKLNVVDFSEEDGIIENQICEYLLNLTSWHPQLNQTATLNQICENLNLDLNETRDRLLNMHKLGIIKCKRIYDIFNSKNYTNLSPKM